MKIKDIRKYSELDVLKIAIAVSQKYNVLKLTKKEYDKILDKAMTGYFSSAFDEDGEKEKTPYFEYICLECLGAIFDEFKNNMPVMGIVMSLAMAQPDLQSWIKKIFEDGISYLQGYEYDF